MQEPTPITRDIVLIGGGHSHVAVLKRFGMRRLPGVRLTLIAREVMTPYSGMLPGLIAGHYGHAEAHIDLRRLCRFAGARLYHSAATGIDLDPGSVHCDSRPPVPYDLLSIDIGSTPSMGHIAGAAEHGLGVKPVDRFLTRWPEIERRAQTADGRLRVVVIGGGAGGVELTLSLQHRMGNALASAGLANRTHFTIVSETAGLLPNHAPAVGRWLGDACERRGVEVIAATRAVAVEPDGVRTDSGRFLPADATVVVTDAAPARWLADTGLALDGRGFIRVAPNLESVSHPGVFAAGDIASIEGYALAKSGVFAVRQGPVLARNLRRAAEGRRLTAYRPQRLTLALISSGDRVAVASYGRLCLNGAWVWKLKDWIDRRWMRKFQELPRMEAPDGAPPGADPDPLHHPGALAMRCGGCGSKVSSAVLRRALARLGRSEHPEVLLGLGRADDAAVIRIPPGKLLVQSVDHFRTFIDDPYLFAKITTNHCLSDLFAMGASPQTAQVMISLPFGPEPKVEEDLFLALSGVSEVLEAVGAVLVGGHTAEGPELSLGLAVNGLIEESALMTKGGVEPGDCLILTKPLGTGVIFAGDMRADAEAAWVETAVQTMLQSNDAAARCLARHGARACTDITGFGLAGHLIEMLTASAASAQLDLARIPPLQGARDLLAAGVRSSLHPANAAFAERMDGVEPDQAPLLFDPQTSGGLLAAVPRDRSRDCLRSLAELGYRHAACIGEVHAVSPAELGQVGRIRVVGSG